MSPRTRIVVPLLIVLTTAQTVDAELRRVELNIVGMDCATCAHGVQVTAEKLSGVEAVEVSLERASAVIRLKRGNDIRMEQLARLIRENGFTVKRAKLTALGSVTLIDGALHFQLNRSGAAVRIVADPNIQNIFRTLESQLAKGEQTRVELQGTVEFRGGQPGPIVLHTFRPEESPPW